MQHQNNGRPVIKTSTIFATSTIPISFGTKKTFTTITSKVGVTTVTEYERGQQGQQRTAAPTIGGQVRKIKDAWGKKYFG